MKQPVDHILRPQLPWRPVALITECGYDASKVKALTRDEYLARFKRGDIVELCGSDGVPCGTLKVVRAGPRVVRTDCGRAYRQGDGCWIDSDRRVWPFPWIQPAGLSRPSGTSEVKWPREGSPHDGSRRRHCRNQ